MEPCEDGLVDMGNGICAEPSLAPEIQELVTEIEAEEAASNLTAGIQARRFQLGTPTNEVSLNSIDTLRTKRRTQRLTLLATKIQNSDKSNKLRPREFLKMMNSYGEFNSYSVSYFLFSETNNTTFFLEKKCRLSLRLSQCSVSYMCTQALENIFLNQKHIIIGLEALSWSLNFSVF